MLGCTELVLNRLAGERLFDSGRNVQDCQMLLDGLGHQGVCALSQGVRM